MNLVLLFVVVLLVLSLMTTFVKATSSDESVAAAADDDSGVKQWWRGCLHAHANWGPPQLPWTSPDVVERWYREHQYNFAAVTDLNYYTPVDGLQQVFDAPGRFITIPGIELSAEPLGVGVKIIDTLGIGVDSTITFNGLSTQLLSNASTVDILESQALDIRHASGLPIIAHPSFTYSVTANDFMALGHPDQPILFELYNGEPGMNFFGGGDKDSVEEMWDKVLSTGRKMYGVGTDDSHHFFEFIQSTTPNKGLANPGRAWIQVRSAKLTWPSLRKAMKAGDFYTTTGITFLDYQADHTGVRISLDGKTRDLGWSNGVSNPQLYRTYFIGQNGAILKLDKTLTPSYTFVSSDTYVRAKVVSSDGLIAWTQPVFRV